MFLQSEFKQFLVVFLHRHQNVIFNVTGKLCIKIHQYSQTSSRQYDRDPSDIILVSNQHCKYTLQSFTKIIPELVELFPRYTLNNTFHDKKQINKTKFIVYKEFKDCQEYIPLCALFVAFLGFLASEVFRCEEVALRLAGVVFLLSFRAVLGLARADFIAGGPL